MIHWAPYRTRHLRRPAARRRPNRLAQDDKRRLLTGRARRGGGDTMYEFMRSDGVLLHRETMLVRCGARMAAAVAAK